MSRGMYMHMYVCGGLSRYLQYSQGSLCMYVCMHVYIY